MPRTPNNGWFISRLNAADVILVVIISSSMF